jgi:tRNA G18 (ribose-2'-O)-methylase SpoU
VITSAQNQTLKLVRKLHSRRWRDKLGLFVAEGEDLVDAALEACLEAVEVLVAGENLMRELLADVST